MEEVLLLIPLFPLIFGLMVPTSPSFTTAIPPARFPKTSMAPAILATKTPLTVVVAPSPPVSVILVTTSSVASGLLFIAARRPRLGVWLDPAFFDVLDFVVTVLLFALDVEIYSLPLGLWVQGEESLLRLLRVKFNEYAALEHFVLCASEPHRVGWTVVSKEGLDVKLSTRLLFAESFGIDTSRHGLVFIYLFNLVHGFVFNAFGQRDFALDARIVVDKIENFAFFEGINDGTQWLKVAHALEGMDDADRDRKVCGALDF